MIIVQEGISYDNYLEFHDNEMYNRGYCDCQDCSDDAQPCV